MENQVSKIGPHIMESFYQVLPIVFHWLSNPARPLESLSVRSMLENLSKKAQTPRSYYRRHCYRALMKIIYFLISPRIWIVSYLLFRWFLTEIRRKQKIFAFRERNCLHTIQAAIYVTENICNLKRLEKRTLFEKRLSDVVFDEEARRWIVDAAKQTTEDEPCLMLFIPPRHRWHILNLVQNQVSSVNAQNYIYFDQRTNEHRVHLKSAWYIFTLFCHRARSRGRYLVTPATVIDGREDYPLLKIRAVLVHEKVLQKVVKGEFKPPAKFFSERHQKRWTILSKIADLYSQQFEAGFEYEHYGVATSDDSSESHDKLPIRKHHSEEKQSPLKATDPHKTKSVLNSNSDTNNETHGNEILTPGIPLQQNRSTQSLPPYLNNLADFPKHILSPSTEITRNCEINSPKSEQVKMETEGRIMSKKDLPVSSYFESMPGALSIQNANSWPAHLHDATSLAIAEYKTIGNTELMCHSSLRFQTKSTNDLLLLSASDHAGGNRATYHKKQRLSNEQVISSLQRTRSITQNMYRNAVLFSNPASTEFIHHHIHQQNYSQRNSEAFDPRSTLNPHHDFRYHNCLRSTSAIDPFGYPPELSVQNFRELRGAEYFESLVIWLEGGGPFRKLIQFVTRLCMFIGLGDIYHGQGRKILHIDTLCEKLNVEYYQQRHKTLTKQMNEKNQKLLTYSNVDEHEDYSHRLNKNPEAGRTIGVTGNASFYRSQLEGELQCWDARESLRLKRKGLKQELSSNATRGMDHPNLSRLNTCCRVHMPFPTLKTKVDNEEIEEVRRDEEFVLFRIGGD